MKKFIIIFIFLLSSGIVLAHGHHGQDCHRDDDNECRHSCHHDYCNCAENCSINVCKTHREKCNSCHMTCFNKHAECIGKCNE